MGNTITDDKVKDKISEDDKKNIESAKTEAQQWLDSN